MNAPAGQDQVDLARLKRLLLSPETDRLETVEQRVQALDERLGAPKRLENATAEILVEAFRKAEVARHRDLANAVAPVVVAAIRSEIKNSKDMMVEALYPITGRLVAAAVANAFRDLVADLNDTIERTLSTRHWRRRLRAIATGRSVTEIALAESQTPQLRRFLVLERGGGRLIAAWRADGEAEETSELVSGLIAAITEFAASVYSAHDGELRTLDLGHTRVFLRATPVYLIAADCAGALRPEHERAFDDAVLSFVGRLDRGETEAGPGVAALAPVLFQSAADDAKKKSSKAPLILAAAVVLGLIGWAASGPVLRAWTERRIETAFAAAMAARPQLAPFPLAVRVDHHARGALIVGLAPAQADVDALISTLAPAAAPYAVAGQTAIVAGQTAVAAAVAQTDAAVAALGAQNAAALDTLHAALAQKANQDDTRAALATVRAALAAADDRAAQDARGLAQMQAALLALQPDARDRLEKLLAHQAIFFQRDDAPVDPARAEATAQAIAAALVGNDLRVRVVGHADSSGGRVRNIELARARAQMAAALLVRAGAPPARVQAVGRADMQPLGDVGAAGDPRDRRVTFETVAEGEP